MAITILIVINVFAAAGIIALVLLQQGKSDVSAAFGGGGSQSMFGSRGSANFLSRTTSILATVFFLSSLTLAYLYAQRDEQKSVTDGSVVIEKVEESEVKAAMESEIPTVPGEQEATAAPAGDEASASDAAEESTDVPAVPQ